MRFYDVSRNQLRGKYNHKAAVLDCCFSDLTHAYSGALDGTLKQCALFPSLGTAHP